MVKLTTDKRAQRYAEDLASSVQEYDAQNAAGKPYDRYGIGLSGRANDMQARKGRETGGFAGGGNEIRSSNLSLGQTQYSAYVNKESVLNKLGATGLAQPRGAAAGSVRNSTSTSPAKGQSGGGTSAYQHTAGGRSRMEESSGSGGNIVMQFGEEPQQKFGQQK